MKPGKDELEAIRHEVRNAVLGLQLERRRVAVGLSQAVKGLNNMKDHLARIEKVLAAESMEGELAK